MMGAATGRFRGVNRIRARAGGPPRRPRPPLSLTANSLALITAKVASMVLGFLFWVLAARLFSRSDVGLAAGVVSAMMLCTQIALLGLGSSVITHFRHQANPGRLVNSAWTLAAAAAAGAALAFLGLAASVLTQLDVVVGSAGYTLLFFGAAVLGTVMILLDQVSTALRRGGQAVARTALFGGCTIAGLAALAATGATGSQAIFAPWVGAGAAACALGAIQLRRSLRAYRPRPALDMGLARMLVRTGVPNHVLTLSERVPGLVLPIMVAELLSPHANAAWYSAWMMAWVAYVVPIQVGMSAFAEVAHNPLRCSTIIRHSLRTSLLVGSSAALALELLADPLLSLLGPSYAADAAAPLRLLALAVVPMSFTYVYYAACRGLGVPERAIGLGWAGVAVAIATTSVAATTGGLFAMAAAWVAVQAALGALAGIRLRVLVGAPGIASGSPPSQAARRPAAAVPTRLALIARRRP